MDFIKKTICLEGARTRTQGLMPYYAFGGEYEEHDVVSGDVRDLGLSAATGENGNWGQFVANPWFLAEHGKTYEAMLRKYYDLLNMVREGVKLRKVQTKEGEIIFTEDLGAFSWNSTSGCFSGGTEPDFLYGYAAYDANDFYSTGIESLRDETKHIYRSNKEVEDTFIVLIEDYETFNELSSYLDGTGYQQVGAGVTIETGPEHFKWARYCQVVDACIGKINIPASIYNKHIKAPKSMPCADVQPYIDWLTNYPKDDCCNARVYDDMGGDEMLAELLKHQGECASKLNTLNGLSYSVPYIEMPILLTQNYTDVGVLTNIDGIPYDVTLSGAVIQNQEETRPHGYLRPAKELLPNGQSALTQSEIDYLIQSGIGVSFDQIIMDTSAHTDGDIEVESLLQTLRNKKKFTDDKDNVLPGDFQYFDGTNNGGKMFRCIKQGEENFYWLVVSERTETVEIGVAETTTEHTLYYEFEEDSSLSKEAIITFVNNRATPGDDPDKHFYHTMQTAPGETFSIRETEPGWQETLAAKKDEMSGSIATNYYLLSPISVALSQWRMETDNVPDDVTVFVNGDGLQSEYVHYPQEQVSHPEGKYYRTITTCAAGIRIAETEEEENALERPDGQPFMEHYYFKVKYDNSENKPMTIPYKVGNTNNVYLVDSTENIYRGDFIISSAVGRTLKVEYVIGGYFTGDENGNYVSWAHQESGDVYYEEYDFDKAHVDYVALDGVDNVPVWSEYIDFEGAAKEFYSTRYGLTRTGNTANIIRLNSGEVWQNTSTVLSPYDAYLTKEEYLTGFSLPPKTDVNVTVDRGGVSAFEKHYKLTECNTMQDLVNYGNNFFNI